MTQTTLDRSITDASKPVRHAWVPYVAVAAGAALFIKAIAIIGSADEAPDTPMALLYLAGILLAVAAAIGTGLRQRRGRRTIVAVPLAVFVAAWIVGIADLLTPLFEVFSDEAYVGDEGPVGVLGLALLVAGSLMGRRDRS